MNEPIEKVFSEIDDALAKLTDLRESVITLGMQVRSIEKQDSILKGVVDELREENTRLRRQVSSLKCKRYGRLETET